MELYDAPIVGVHNYCMYSGKEIITQKIHGPIGHKTVLVGVQLEDLR